MRVVRTVIAVAMILIGGAVVFEMLHYPLRNSITGIGLGGAMIALGIVRLRALYARTGRA